MIDVLKKIITTHSEKDLVKLGIHKARIKHWRAIKKELINFPWKEILKKLAANLKRGLRNYIKLKKALGFSGTIVEFDERLRSMYLEAINNELVLRRFIASLSIDMKIMDREALSIILSFSKINVPFHPPATGLEKKLLHFFFRKTK